MFDRKRRHRAVKALHSGVGSAIGFLENSMPRGIEKLGHALHDKAASLRLMNPRHPVGAGVALGFLGLAVAGVVAFLARRGGMERLSS